jgi:hypothetical protein
MVAGMTGCAERSLEGSWMDNIYADASYRITVESVKSPTHADLIAHYGEGNFSKLWDDRKHFIELHPSLQRVAPPKGEITVLVKVFNDYTYNQEVIEWADENGYRLVFPWEREVFSKTYPKLQEAFDIKDLGTYTMINDGIGPGYSPRLSRGITGFGKNGLMNHSRMLLSSTLAGCADRTTRFLFASK